jgi:hypothetical protein
VQLATQRPLPLAKASGFILKWIINHKWNYAAHAPKTEHFILVWEFLLHLVISVRLLSGPQIPHRPEAEL